jgi:hypothetical protein
MKHIGLVAFTTTVGVLVPLILHGGRDQVAKLVAPGRSTITVGGASIEVTADRAIVDPGKKVKVELTATAAGHAHPRLAVLVYEQRGMGNYRNELPPRLVDETEVTLDVSGGKPVTKQVALALPGHRYSDMEGKWLYGHYTVLVMPPAEAERLHKIGRKTSSENGGDLDSAVESAGRSAQPDDGDDTKPPMPTIARIDVITRAARSPVSIHAAESARVGSDIAVEVRVRNPTSHAIAEVGVDLTATPTLELVSDAYRGIPADQVKITAPENSTIKLGPHETKTVVFHVAANARGVLGLFASAHCLNEGGRCYENDGTSVDDSVLEAIDITDAQVAKR